MPLLTDGLWASADLPNPRFLLDLPRVRSNGALRNHPAGAPTHPCDSFKIPLKFTRVSVCQHLGARLRYFPETHQGNYSPADPPYELRY